MAKYLILSATYWSWHNAAKNAIIDFLDQTWNETMVLDLVKFMWKKWESSKKFYEFSTEKIPFIWQITYFLFEIKLYQKLFWIYINLFYQKSFDKILQEYKPDYIINLFPDWIKFLKNYFLKFKKTSKTATIITDAINIWLPWYYWNEVIDQYFVIDKWSKDTFNKKFKHKRDNINVSFFPIEEKYFTNKINITNKKIIFILTGINKDFAVNFLGNLQKESFFEKIIICWWRNKTLFDLLKNNLSDTRFEFHDFPNIKETLKTIDIAIAKPGWAIMAECIANDVFLISPTFIPGQEEWNIKLLELSWVGFFEKNPEKIVSKIKENSFYKNLDNFKKIKRQDSVKYIIDSLKAMDLK